jgi:monoamine oxidase
VELTRADVVVVGAGLAGLTAARRLIQAGLDVLVLEAKDAPGGRTVRLPSGIDGLVLDGGGELIGPGQDALFGLLDELGLAWFDTHYSGLGIYELEGERGTFTGGIPPLAPEAQAAYEQATRDLDRLAEGVPPDAPWDAPNASELDRLSLAAWLDLNVPEVAARKVLIRKFVNATGMPATQLSFLYVLTHLAGCGGMARTFSAGSYRIAGGSYVIAERLAADLGDRVRLGSPVREIEQLADSVRVCSDAVEIVADLAIVALPPGDCRTIQVRPALPVQRTLLQGAWRAGSVYKFHAVYREPFWREQGYSGYAYLDLGAIPSVYDASPPDGSVGVIMVWVMPYLEGLGFGDPALVYDDADARREALLGLLAAWFGPQALDPLTCVEKDWINEPYHLGCGCGMAPGVLTTYGPALREPAGRIHWASSETAVHWSGYINGAVESGERAAREVLAAIR